MKKRGFIALLLAFVLSYSCTIEEIITQGDTDTLVYIQIPYTQPIMIPYMTFM